MRTQIFGTRKITQRSSIIVFAEPFISLPFDFIKLIRFTGDRCYRYYRLDEIRLLNTESKKLIEVEGYHYSLNRTGVLGRYWRCCRNSKCRVTAVLRSDTFLVSGRHQHPEETVFSINSGNYASPK